MRILSSIISLLFVASATLSGCDDSKRAKTIVEDAKKCKKPSKDEVSIVYKQLKREGANISESETGELLNLVCDARMERDPIRQAQMVNRYNAIVSKAKMTMSIAGLLID